MPELPEVETIRRRLEPQLVGEKILSAEVLWDRTISTPSVSDFRQSIIGQSIVAVERRAKYIILKLTKDSLLIHLRMSGDLFVTNGDRSPAKHDRLIIKLSHFKILTFNDTRKFGRAWLVSDQTLVTGDLGPEPLSEDFSLDLFQSILKKRQCNIKAFLLDQTQIAGLGNIYTDESLFLAGILPTRNTAELTDPQIERLHEAIVLVLNEGIRQNGASFDWVYRGGNFQNNFNVYQRAGLDCKVCGKKITKITVHQRGTHYCGNCQR